MTYLLLLALACTTTEDWEDQGYEDACDDVRDAALFAGIADGHDCEWGYEELASHCPQSRGETWAEAWYAVGYEAGCYHCAADNYTAGYNSTCLRTEPR